MRRLLQQKFSASNVSNRPSKRPHGVYPKHLYYSYNDAKHKIYATER